MEIYNWDEILLPYQQTVDELLVKLSGLSAGFIKLDKPSPIERVHGRVKTAASILDKCNRKSIDTENMFDEVQDIAGIRIISRFLGDIDRVIELFRERSGRDLMIVDERDYITNIKPSGYRSYHLIVKYPVISAHGYSEPLCEVQIRTMAMDFWATVEHSLVYKYKGKLPDHIRARLISAAEAAAQLDGELNEIRGEILDAQTVISERTVLIDSILKSIQNLHYNSSLKKVQEINAEFYRLHDNGTMEQLAEFDRQLQLMKDMYRV